MARVIAGPSGSNKTGRPKKRKQNALNSSKIKRTTEKQKIEALERDAMTFVRFSFVSHFMANAE
jgi:hypothetical protein